MARQAVMVKLSPKSRAELRKLGRAKLMPDVRRAFMEATHGAVPAVRAEIRSKPSEKKGRGKESLRSQVAMAIKRRRSIGPKRVSVSIVSEPHGGLSNLARAVEGEIDWEHPVFGREGTKVTQKPMPFFYETLDRFVPGVEARIRSALIRFERRF